MNSVVPISITPCRTIVIASVFENLLCAKHSIVARSFDFHTGIMTEKVLSLLQMKILKL